MKKLHYIHSFSRYDLEGNIDTIIENLKKLKVDHPDADERGITLDFDADYDGYLSITAKYWREETEEEKKNREEQEARFKKIRDDRDKAEYNRLKKKYGEQA